MKWSLSVLLLISFNSYADLRVTVPKESSISNFDLRDGELFTSEDSRTLYMHTNSVIAPVSNPAGSILAFGGASAPAGYLLCNGLAVSRTTYADLFASIGTAFGEGDGTTTFNLPDFQGRFLRGVDNSAGLDPDKATRTAMAAGGNSGNNVGSVQSDELKSHSHPFRTANKGSASSYSGGSFHHDNGAINTHTASAGGTETRPKNAYVNYIIKY